MPNIEAYLVGGSPDGARDPFGSYSQRGDRPLPIPPNSSNLSFVSQLVEIADDVVFTIEYSIRTAQMAVYELLHIDQKIPTSHTPRQIIAGAV